MKYALTGSVVAFACIACGARGPLSYEIIDVPVAADASAPGNGSTGPGNTTPGGPTQPGGGTTPPGGGPVDAGGISIGPILGALGIDSGIINCGACAATQCGSAFATCFADTTCSGELTCILQTCLAGGATGAGAGCFTGCSSGGISGLTSLLPIITCLTGTCGPSCGSLLGGVGGLGGAIRGEQVPDDQLSISPSAREVLFTAYPQLASPAPDSK